MSGVWAVGEYDGTWTIRAVYSRAEEAINGCNDHEIIRWLPFGVDCQDAYRKVS